MATLIYCKQQVATTPYFIEEVSLNVYSLEELSYYMLNNVYLLNNTFMSVELCNWIGRELKLNKLATELLDLIQNNAPLHIFAGKILSSSGYASKKEIKDLLSVIATFEYKSEAECKKIRGDRLMDKGRLVDAVLLYETLVSTDTAKTLSKETLGDVYHNLGCAYAKLFFFDVAMNCFDEAYKRNQKKNSLLCMLYAARCKKDANAFEAAVLRYQVSREDVEEVNSFVDKIASSQSIKEFDAAINEIADQYTSGDEIMARLTDVIDDWKKDYNRLCRL
ncbi:MAG: hypothetical protein HUJ71_06265 [Pseudobutyrivibrio sp.]|nr:hypothetical protein [Pseudobutyrivibrio sp.]